MKCVFFSTLRVTYIHYKQHQTMQTMEVIILFSFFFQFCLLKAKVIILESFIHSNTIIHNFTSILYHCIKYIHRPTALSLYMNWSIYVHCKINVYWFDLRHFTFSQFIIVMCSYFLLCFLFVFSIISCFFFKMLSYLIRCIYYCSCLHKLF